MSFVMCVLANECITDILVYNIYMYVTGSAKTCQDARIF